MKTITLLTFIFFKINCYFCQVNVDSLIGVYAGKAYQKYVSAANWTILDDTITVKSIDSLNCQILIYSTTCCWSQGPAAPFYTVYSPFCTNSFSNNYFKFCPLDSMLCLFDSIPQPWPNSPYSLRFYGKKIAPYIITGIVSKSFENKIILVYPNPTKEKLNIVFQQSEFAKRYEVINIDSKIVKQQILNTNTKEIEFDIGKLEEGIYFIRVETANSVFTKTIVVEH